MQSLESKIEAELNEADTTEVERVLNMLKDNKCRMQVLGSKFFAKALCAAFNSAISLPGRLRKKIVSAEE